MALVWVVFSSFLSCDFIAHLVSNCQIPDIYCSFGEQLSNS